MKPKFPNHTDIPEKSQYLGTFFNKDVYFFTETFRSIMVIEGKSPNNYATLPIKHLPTLLEAHHHNLPKKHYLIVASFAIASHYTR